MTTQTTTHTTTIAGSQVFHFFTGKGSAQAARSEAAKYGAKVSKIAFGDMAGAHTFTVARSARPMTEADFDVWA